MPKLCLHMFPYQWESSCGAAELYSGPGCTGTLGHLRRPRRSYCGKVERSMSTEELTM